MTESQSADRILPSDNAEATMKPISRPPEQLLFLTLAVFLLAPGVRAMSGGDSTQASAGAVKVTLRDGSVLIGIVAAQAADSIEFQTVSGISIKIAKKDIKSTDRLRGKFQDGLYRRTDPDRSRLFLSPTARPLKGGEATISDIMIFFPYIAVGLCDYVSVGGGMTLFPGAPSQIFYFAPKISIPVYGDDVHVGAGVLYSNFTSGDFEGLGMAYGMVTAGSPYASFTVGVGKGFVAGSFAESATLMLGGEAQISNSVAVITENWFPTGSDAQFLSLGLRFFGEHLSADFGLIQVLYRGSSSEGIPVIPWIGFSYHFGK